MRHKIILLLSLSCVLLLMNACCNKPDKYLTLPASAYDYVAYDSTSSFTMQDAWGNQNHFVFEQIQRDDAVNVSCFECCGNTYDQQYKLIMRGDNPAVALEIELSHGSGGEVGYFEDVLMVLKLSPAFSSGTLLDHPICPLNNALTCIDSFAVAGQIYTNVLQFENEQSAGSTDSTAGKTLWYSQSAGVLKLEMQNGKIWELMP